jgi:DNA-binding response OmpR family regulator
MVVLCAEGDVWVKHIIWQLLNADGFTVLTAGDGETALEVSRDYPGSIDLLLLPDPGACRHPWPTTCFWAA